MQRKESGKHEDHFVEVQPNASRLIHALREMGYGSFDSVLDLIDNSIDAKATKVWVTIKELRKGSIVIDIQDDGIGMDEPTIRQALRLGSDVEHKVEVDLGKYGMGLVTASISMARNVWVLTRKKSAQAYEATFDIDTIERKNKFVINLQKATSNKVVGVLGEQGTLVRLSSIDRINDTNVARFAATLRVKIGQVYRHFLKRGLQISVNNRSAIMCDPLMLDHELTTKLLDQDIELGKGSRAHLTVVQLPELGNEADEKAGILPKNSGFYIVRNAREIMEAQTFGYDGLANHHHSYSRFRAELAFDGSLDNDFHVDIKKSVIHPNDYIKEKLYAKVKGLIAEVGRRGRDTAEPLKLTHGAAEERINQLLLLAAPPTPPTPKAKGKASKGPKLDILTEVETPTPALPAMKFTEEDAGAKGRFYSVERKLGCPILIKYNRQHPIVIAAAAKSRPTAILDFMVYAMAEAEAAVEGGTAFVNHVCSELSRLLAAPVEQQ